MDIWPIVSEAVFILLLLSTCSRIAFTEGSEFDMSPEVGCGKSWKRTPQLLQKRVGNPPQLNEFLEDVLRHKNDFNFVREAARRYENKKQKKHDRSLFPDKGIAPQLHQDYFGGYNNFDKSHFANLGFSKRNIHGYHGNQYKRSRANLLRSRNPSSASSSSSLRRFRRRPRYRRHLPQNQYGSRRVAVYPRAEVGNVEVEGGDKYPFKNPPQLTKKEAMAFSRRVHGVNRAKNRQTNGRRNEGDVAYVDLEMKAEKGRERDEEKRKDFEEKQRVVSDDEMVNGELSATAEDEDEMERDPLNGVPFERALSFEPDANRIAGNNPQGNNLYSLDEEQLSPVEEKIVPLADMGNGKFMIQDPKVSPEHNFIRLDSTTSFSKLLGDDDGHGADKGKAKAFSCRISEIAALPEGAELRFDYANKAAKPNDLVEDPSKNVEMLRPVEGAKSFAGEESNSNAGLTDQSQNGAVIKDAFPFVENKKTFQDDDAVKNMETKGTPGFVSQQKPEEGIVSLVDQQVKNSVVGEEGNGFENRGQGYMRPSKDSSAAFDNPALAQPFRGQGANGLPAARRYGSSGRFSRFGSPGTRRENSEGPYSELAQDQKRSRGLLSFSDDDYQEMDEDEGQDGDEFESLPRARRDFADAMGMKDEDDYSDDNPYKHELQEKSTDVKNDTHIHPGHTNHNCSTTSTTTTKVDTTINRNYPGCSEDATAATEGPLCHEKNDLSAISDILVEEPKALVADATIGESFKKQKQGEEEEQSEKKNEEEKAKEEVKRGSEAKPILHKRTKNSIDWREIREKPETAKKLEEEIEKELHEDESDAEKRTKEDKREATSETLVASKQTSDVKRKSVSEEEAAAEDYFDNIEGDDEAQRDTRDVAEAKRSIADRILKERNKLMNKSPKSRSSKRRQIKNNLGLKKREEQTLTGTELAIIDSGSSSSSSSSNSKKKFKIFYHNMDKKQDEAGLDIDLDFLTTPCLEELANPETTTECGFGHTTAAQMQAKLTDFNDNGYMMVAKKIDEETEKLNQVLDGSVATKIVSLVFDEVKKEQRLKNKFLSGLSRKHFGGRDSLPCPGDTDVFASEDEEAAEAKVLMLQMTQALNKLVLKQVGRKLCQRLPEDLQKFLKSIVNIRGVAQPVVFVPNPNQGNYLFAGSHNEKNDECSDADVQHLQETLVALEGLLLKYHKMNEECQKSAENVKEYIDSHVSVLRKMVACPENNCGAAKRDTVGGEYVEDHEDMLLPNLDLETLIGYSRGRGSGRNRKREAGYGRSGRFGSGASSKFRKLQRAVERVRERRESARKIGEAFGADKVKRDVDYERPLVYSL